MVGADSGAVVELVARAEFEADMTPESLYTWDQAPPYVRTAYMDRVRAGLDALRATGRLLPEGTRVRIVYGRRVGDQVSLFRNHGRRPADIPGGRGYLVQRQVFETPWVPIFPPDTSTEGR